MEKVKCIIDGKLVVAEKISEHQALFNGRVVDAEIIETVQLNKYHICHQVGDHVCGYNFFGKSFTEASKDAETKGLSIIYISKLN